MAEKFGKGHNRILKDIRRIIAVSGSQGLSNFAQTHAPDSQGKSQPYYELTRAGFSILVMGFTDPETFCLQIHSKKVS